MTRISLTLLLLLFCSASSDAEVLFNGKWSTVRGRLTSMWAGVHSVSPDRFRLDRDPTNTGGFAVVRVEVRPGDKPSGFSGERSEVFQMQSHSNKALPVNANSGHEFYGISVKLNPAWQAPRSKSGGPEWGTFFQLHGPDAIHASPSFALMAENDFHLNLCVGDVSDGGKRTTLRGAVSHPFSDGALNLGHWTQFLVDVVWAPDESGSVTVYRRDEGKAEWAKVLEKSHTPTLLYVHGQPVESHYWKCGYYRCESNNTNVLWIGTVARGLNREEVIKAAFGK